MTKSTKAIFIHVPKTGGMSIIRAIRKYKLDVRYGHHRISYYNKNEIQESFTFSFVRNPYDRFVSGFYYLKNGGINKQDKKLGELLPNNIEECLIMLKSLDRTQLTVNGVHIFHLTPQFYWHNREVDFIGKFERLDVDFKKAIKNITDNNITLEKVNASKNNKHYTEYLSPTSIDCINTIFEKDFEKYGYKFL